MAVDNARDPASEIVALAPGTVFHGVYEVLRCIKAGGMGAVYEVLQTTTQRYRALKVMLPSLVSDQDARARFELEARIAAGIESEHIVETLDAGIDQATGMPFIMMELLKGEELGALIKSRKRLPPEDVITYMHQAALALDRTHAAGIVHRDLKPENLFLTRRDDGSPRIKILDFGVAKIVSDGSVNADSTKTVGSPMYMGPEQISGEKIGPAVDRYSLAQIAFTLLVGRPYWAIERKAADGIFPFMMTLVKGAQVPASARAMHYGVRLPEEVDAWFVKATAVDPSKRFESCAAMIADLAQIFGITSPTVTLTPKPRAPLPTAHEKTAPEKAASEQAAADKAAPEQATPEKAASSNAVRVESEEPAPSASGETTPKDVVAPARSDEGSLQPVSVNKPTRSWVVPSLLLIVVLGAVGAFLIWPQLSPQTWPQSWPKVWPQRSAPAAPQSSESVRMPAESPQSAVLPASSTLASPTSRDASSVASAAPEPATSNVSLGQSAAPVASAMTGPVTSSSPGPSATTSAKPFRRKRNDVLDQY